MNRHQTPDEVARALAKHAPKSIDSLLDPAVGEGVLLEPLAPRLVSAEQIICLDADDTILSKVRAKFKPVFGNALHLLHTDFLRWSTRRDSGFDCIVMNPPFCGKRTGEVKLDLAKEFPGSMTGCRSMPIEAAFMVRAVRLLRPNGRLLAVVPRSLISSSNSSWLREFLIQIGSVPYVHELPRYTFKDVEARVYLFVYELGSTRRTFVLCNHDLRQPARLMMKKQDLLQEVRFDFGFHRAKIWCDAIQRSSSHLGWSRLDSHVFFRRGSLDSAKGARHAVHTCDYQDGFWRPGRGLRSLRRDHTDRGVKGGDLLMKRVGRHGAQSISMVIGGVGCACSDCVLMIRPNLRGMGTKILFALRVLLAWPVGAALVERGTGATYITEGSLAKLLVPVELARWYRRQYVAYEAAVRRKEAGSMRTIEWRVRRLLSRRIRRRGGVSTSINAEWPNSRELANIKR